MRVASDQMLTPALRVIAEVLSVDCEQDIFQQASLIGRKQRKHLVCSMSAEPDTKSKAPTSTEEGDDVEVLSWPRLHWPCLYCRILLVSTNACDLF